jgi:tetratricopeptide (TPR) repeat protein
MSLRAVLLLVSLLVLIVPRPAGAETAEDTYKAKLAVAGPDDADSHFQLGLWCKGNGMNAHALEQFQKTIEIDPSHEAAHRQLGYERVNGAWYKGDDVQVAKGLVQYKGAWVTKEYAANTDKGLVQYQGKWMSPEDMYKAKGYVKYLGTWISASRLKTIRARQDVARARSKFASDWSNAWVYTTKEGHFEIRSNVSQQSVEEIGLAMEQCYAQLANVLSARGKIKLVGVEVYANQQQFMEHSAAAHLPVGDNVLGYFYYGQNMGIRCFYAGSLDRTLSTLFHECTHLVIHQACGEGVDVPTWANEGLAVFFESAERDEKGLNLQTVPWARLWQLQEIVKQGDVSLDRLCSLQGMRQYTGAYYPQGWSLIYYLLYGQSGKRRQPFEDFYEQLTHGKFDGNGVELFRKSFHSAPDDLKSEWLSYFAKLEPHTTAELVSACTAACTEWLDFDAAKTYADRALASVKSGKDDKVLLCNARLNLTLGQWLGTGAQSTACYAKSVDFFEQLYPPPGKDGKPTLVRSTKLLGVKWALDRIAFAKACIGAKRYEQAQDIIDDILGRKEFECNGDAYSCLALLAVSSDDPAFHDLLVAKENVEIADDLGADQDNKYVHALIEFANGHPDKAAVFLSEAASRDEFGFGGQFYRRELGRLAASVRRATAPAGTAPVAPAPGQ